MMKKFGSALNLTSGGGLTQSGKSTLRYYELDFKYDVWPEPKYYRNDISAEQLRIDISEKKGYYHTDGDGKDWMYNFIEHSNNAPSAYRFAFSFGEGIELVPVPSKHWSLHPAEMT